VLNETDFLGIVPGGILNSGPGCERDQPYANLPAQSHFDKGAPLPPQRGSSSYEVANNSFMNRSNNGIRSNDLQTSVSSNNSNNYRGMTASRSHPGPELSMPPGTIPKKSVSFNTQPDTHLYG
jgi:hypothetical protein